MGDDHLYRPVGLAVRSSSHKRKGWGANLGPAKLNGVLPTACHRCNISLKEALFPGCNDLEMGPASWLHALRQKRKYNETFVLMVIRIVLFCDMHNTQHKNFMYLTYFALLRNSFGLQQTPPWLQSTRQAVKAWCFEMWSKYCNKDTVGGPRKVAECDLK